MEHDVRIAQDNIRRYREMLEQEGDFVARAKLQGLIMAEEDKVAYLSREAFEMEDRVSGAAIAPASTEPDATAPAAQGSL